jgi:hypothetical protein
MISAGNRNPLYDGAPVPTSPAPSTLHTDTDHPNRQAASQVDDAVSQRSLSRVGSTWRSPNT